MHGVLTRASISFGNANSEFQVGINQGPIYLAPGEFPEALIDPDLVVSQRPPFKLNDAEAFGDYFG